MPMYGIWSNIQFGNPRHIDCGNYFVCIIKGTGEELIVRWEGILITIGLTVIVGLWLLWVSKKYPNAFD